MDRLAREYPEQTENVARLREIAHEANATTDPAVHARLGAELDALLQRMRETPRSAR
jgi:hypothetical protein